MSDIVLDFETKSRIDIKKAGTDRYAVDPSTDILCCAFYNLDTEEALLWYPDAGALPQDWQDALTNAPHIWAHNARFDQLIYECIAVEDYGFPELRPEQWACTSALSRVNARPASLDDATRSLNTRYRKNHRGAYLIRQLSIPNKETGEFRQSTELLAEMGKYCMDDIKATVALKQALRPPGDDELSDWQINERINDNGVRVDRELASLAMAYADDERQEIAERLELITEGAITAHSQHQRIAHFVHSALTAYPRLQEQLWKTNAKGERKLSCDKTIRENLLQEVDLPRHVREVIQLVHDGGKSSVSKYERMRAMAMPGTDRVHGVFVYAGAGQTKRYASRGLQLHNMARDCFTPEQTEQLKADMKAGRGLPKPVMHTLSKLLRPSLIPAEGCSFVVGDWSAIEARVLPWLSDSPGGCSVLKVFKKGEDIYTQTAHNMGITDRQIGKVAVLSLGYGGAFGAFSAMAKNYGLDLPEYQINDVVDLWRRSNQWAVTFWRDLERAAKRAVNHPGEQYAAGRVRYVKLGDVLYCILPDDSVIQYPDANYDKDSQSVTCIKASVKPKVDDPEWPRMVLWGGILAENITQAVAACLLRDLLRRLDINSVVGHVHDEVILEVPTSSANEVAKQLKIAMETSPTWADDLPLTAEPEIKTRYGK